MWIYHALVLFGLLLMGLNLMLNLRCFKTPPQTSRKSRDGDPFISVLIPARNESGNIAEVLETLRLQDYENFEIIVLDDHSTDDTFVKMRAAADLDQRVRCVRGQSLPQGWTGKAWACHQLSTLAGGEVLVFIDADTRLSPTCMGSALDFFCENRADLLSLWPRQLMVTWSEKLIIPFVHVLLLLFLPHWLEIRSRSLAAANGQFMMFCKKAYRSVGGHEKVRSHLVEDIALAREIKMGGHRLVNADGSQLVRCRMYHCFGQLWEGFTKNLRAAFEDSLSGFLMMGLLQLTLLLLPFGFFIAELLGGTSVKDIEFLLILHQVVFIMLFRLLLACTFHHSLIGAALHPIGQALALVIAFNSWIRTSAGRVTWKNRSYRVEVSNKKFDAKDFM